MLADYSRAVRLAALCLAVEAKRAEDDVLVGRFLSIAGGALLSQRRQDGAVASDETIVLATS